MKRCSKCGRILPETEFYNNRESGLTSWCKGCYLERRKAQQAQRRLLHPKPYEPTKEELVELYVRQKRSLTGIAKMLGTNYSLVRNKALEYGIKIRSIKESIRYGIDLGYVDCSAKKKPKISADERKRRSERLKKYRTSIPAKGYSQKATGYCEVTSGPNKFRCLHDVIMEEHIGRRLRPDECVHHINHDPSDNRIENLLLMTRSEHSKLHAKERRKQNNNKSL